MAVQPCAGGRGATTSGFEAAEGLGLSMPKSLGKPAGATDE